MQYLTSKEELAVTEFSSKVRSFLGSNLIKLELFGSKVSGKFTKFSDIDIFVLVNTLSLDLINKIAEMSLQVDLKYDVLLSPLIYDKNEFEQNKKLSSPIIKELDTRGIVL